MDTASFDTIVLGLGAMGSAAAYQLAKKGSKVLGIDQFSPPHHFGSTHGDTRVTRQAIGEGNEYVPLVLRSYEIFREIEKETGKDLLTVTGILTISTNKGPEKNFFKDTVAAAKAFNIEHEVLTAAQIRERFPQFNVDDDEEGYFEPGAGFLRPEECVAAQIELAKKYGAQINLNEKVLKYEAHGDKVTVTTDKGEYVANKLIISAGSWIPELVPEEYRPHFKICRQVLYWFDIKDSAEPFMLKNMPTFIWCFPEKKKAFYGFPALDEKGGVKVATHQTEITTKPDLVDRKVTPEEIKEMYDTFIDGNFPGLTENCVKSLVCLYSITPDFGFIIDKHPSYENVIIASPCSGHGFKHSSAIGEVLAELAIEGKSKLDISKFGFKRFTTKANEELKI